MASQFILELPPLLPFLLLPLLHLHLHLCHAQHDVELTSIPINLPPLPSPSPSPAPSAVDPQAHLPLPSPPTPKPKPTYRQMVRDFIRTHNAVRSAIGEPPFVWDRKIARHARLWSEKRRGDCALVHSGNPDYGENMFWGGGSEWTAGEAVRFWADEHVYYDPVSNSCEFGRVCGHFTQMVWNTTVRVGCGRAECNDGGVIITCNYYPPGNWLGEKPF